VTPSAQPLPARRLRRLLPLAAAIALVAAAVVLGITVFKQDDATPDSPSVTGPESAPFRLDYPSNWRALSAAEREQLPNQPLAVLRRKDGHGTVVVQRRGPVTTPLEQLPEKLAARLDKQFPDFREVGARIVRLDGTRALLYTFARTKTGAAQSLVVIPAGDHSFTLNAVVPAHSPDAAREVGAMIASFRPSGDR
jgi:hypothetical protein